MYVGLEREVGGECESPCPAVIMKFEPATAVKQMLFVGLTISEKII